MQGQVLSFYMCNEGSEDGKELFTTPFLYGAEWVYRDR